MQTAVGVVQWFLLVIALLLSVPVAVLAVQIANAVRGPKPVARRDAGVPVAPGQAPASDVTAVLMPAHDEASGITAAIATVRSQLAANDRLVVIADNCSDDTARVAAAAGAEVIERTDGARRGKGFALDYGVRHLALRPPAVVIVIDADCVVAPDAIERIARLSCQSGRPVQALYLMHAPPGAPLQTRIAEFAWLVKNQVRASGFARLGLPCQLMGSGMAFPWRVISTAPLASGQIVEDLQLGLELAAAGTPPLYCAQALVTSMFPSAAGLASQRIRWEHGHLAIIAKMAPRMFAMALARRSRSLLAMALDVCVPPIAALVMALAGVLAISVLLRLIDGEAPASAAILAGLALAVLAASLSAAWRRFGRSVVTSAELAKVPAYVVAKLPMYLRMLWKRQTEWVRTKRDGGA